MVGVANKLTLQERLLATLDFVRTYGHLDNGAGPTLKLGRSSEDPVERAFERAAFGLPGYTARTLRAGISEQLPNDPNIALVDVGSHLGLHFANEFARAHPNMTVVRVDSMGSEELHGDGPYTQFENAHARTVGFYARVPVNGNVALGMNALLHANGFANNHYVDCELTAKTVPRLAHDLIFLRGKHSVVTALRAPEDLGVLALRTYERMGAAEACVTMSALENLEMGSETMRVVAGVLRRFGCTETEIRKYHKLLHGRRAADWDEKFDVKEPEQYRFGVMLKQLAVLSVAWHTQQKGHFVRVGMRYRDQGANMTYNQPSHVLTISRPGTAPYLR